MKLYYSPVACSLAPHIVLHEAGLTFEPVLVNLKKHQLAADSSSYYAINSKGYVPMLQLENGECLTEGPAIMQYLADQVPAKNLAPANGTMARYRLQEWLNFITSELHKGIAGLFNSTMPEEAKVIMRNKALKNLTWTDAQLQGKSYLMGEVFCVADAYLFTVANWTQFLGIDAAHLGNLSAFQARMRTRPAVLAAMTTEGLLNS